mmetsp:Transcript_6226/g.9572  ORF Transcript_6226/g.9572 Transcript_6226/m.9572 type:complete len:414 (+) Transcript_6226:34-1275(+)
MLLPHQVETEIRDPLFQFSLPYLDSIYAFYWVSSVFWLELLLFIILEAGFAIVCGWVIYTYIIEPKRAGTTFAYLIGYGSIVPFWILGSEYFIYILDVRNIFMRFCVGCIVPTKCLFNVSEAINGFSPSHATESLPNYLLHYACIMLPSRNKSGSLIRLSLKAVINIGTKFLVYLFILGAQQSFMSQYKYFAVFKDPINVDDEWFSIKRFLHWQLYANSFMQAVLFQLYLSTFGEALRLVCSIALGCEMQEMMANPLFTSRSPSDFWGRRWNLLVHSLLKGGIFKPVRKYFSSTVATVAAFLASGALHEWILYILFMILPTQLDENGECASCYKPTYGGSMVFFLWQAALIAIELMVGKYYIFQLLGQNLPIPIRATLVVCLGLPFAHFFLESYVKSDFFRHGQQALPMFLPL